MNTYASVKKPTPATTQTFTWNHEKGALSISARAARLRSLRVWAENRSCDPSEDTKVFSGQAAMTNFGGAKRGRKERVERRKYTDNILSLLK